MIPQVDPLFHFIIRHTKYRILRDTFFDFEVDPGLGPTPVTGSWSDHGRS